MVHAGVQQGGLTEGTGGVRGMAGLGRAGWYARQALGGLATVGALGDGLERRVREIAPDTTVIGAGEGRLPNNAKCATPGLSSETQVMGLDLAGVAVSAGSACAAGTAAPPYVLGAMGVPDELALCGIRVSLGWSSTAAHVDAFVAGWRALYDRAGGGVVSAHL